MTYSKITLNSLLCIMAFDFLCYATDDPFSSIVFESKNQSNLSTLMHIPKPLEKNNDWPFNVPPENSPSFPKTETTTSSIHTLESDDFSVGDRSSSSAPLVTTISSEAEHKPFGESRHRSSSCFPKIRSSKSPVDSPKNQVSSPTFQADIDSFPDQAQTATPKGEAPSTVGLRLPPSVNPNRDSVRITLKAMEEFLEKRHTVKITSKTSRNVPEPLDIRDETSSSHSTSTRNNSLPVDNRRSRAALEPLMSSETSSSHTSARKSSPIDNRRSRVAFEPLVPNEISNSQSISARNNSLPVDNRRSRVAFEPLILDETSSSQSPNATNNLVFFQEDISNHPMQRSPLSSQQRTLSYSTQYMPMPSYPSQFVPPCPTQFLPPMTTYPTQFMPPYHTQFLPPPTTPRCTQSSNSPYLKNAGNSPDQSSGILSQPPLSGTMNQFEADGGQNSQSNNGLPPRYDGNSPDQSPGVLSQPLLPGTINTPELADRNQSGQNNYSSSMISGGNSPGQSPLSRVSYLQGTSPLYASQSNLRDLSPKNTVVPPQQGATSPLSAPCPILRSCTSPELGHRNTDAIKSPHSHVYANSSHELGRRSSNSAIFCDSPRVGDGNSLLRMSVSRDDSVANSQLSKNSNSDSDSCSDESATAKVDCNYKVVLSVDGGGVRGIMPAMILKNVYDKLGGGFKFDLMGGTSVGALVVTAFALGKIDHFINDYNAVAKKIFMRNWSLFNPLNWFGITRGLLGPSYRSDSKQEAIRDFVEEKEESDYSFDAIGTRMLFPFYLQQNSTVAHYRNFDEVSNPNIHKYSLIDSLMSTTAAPTFFNPHVFDGLDGCRYEGIDGGVFANNPAFASYNEARQLFPQSRIILLSLGTGDHNYMDPNFESTDRGNLFWAKKYPTITNSAMTSQTHKALTQKASDGKLDYYRINPHLLPYLCNSMDNTSPTYIGTLKAYVNRAIAHSKELQNFVEKVRKIKELNTDA